MTTESMRLELQAGELAAGARSYIYRLLANSFSYPTDSFTESLQSGEWASGLSRLGNHLPFEFPRISQPPTAAPSVLQQAYVSMFEVGAGRPFCPLYEGSHRSGRMKIMEELVRFYEHFGLKTEPGDHPDHLCTELEFMHYLAFKEAAALAHDESVADVRRAQRDFLGRHLCRWLPRLGARMQSADDAPRFYLFASELADEFCRRDLAWLKTG